MKTLPLFAALSVACCVVMVVADYFLGSRAEFLNAYSVLERLTGQAASAGKSLVAMKYGSSGELLGVLLVCCLGGSVFTLLAKRLLRAKDDAK